MKVGSPSITLVTLVIEGSPSITLVTLVTEGLLSITLVTLVTEGFPSITLVTLVVPEAVKVKNEQFISFNLFSVLMCFGCVSKKHYSIKYLE